MSPILVRPVREQLEHDRVIRLLQAKYKRKFEVGINPGNEQTTPVGTGPAAWYPDLVLQSADKARKLLGVVEVETAESVNHLEAMSQWVTFSKFRAPFHLYVPQSMIDPARRLCSDLQVSMAELWMYNLIGDQMRFTLVQRAHGSEGKARPSASAERRPAKARPATTREKVRPASSKTAAARPARRAAPAAAPPRRKMVAVKAAAKAKPARSAAKNGAAKNGAAKNGAAKNGASKSGAAKKKTKTSGSARPQKRK